MGRIWAPHRNVLRGGSLGFAPAVPLPLGEGGEHLSEFTIKSIWFVGREEEEGKRERKGGEERWKRKFVERQRGRERMGIRTTCCLQTRICFCKNYFDANMEDKTPEPDSPGGKVVH